MGAVVLGSGVELPGTTPSQKRFEQVVFALVKVHVPYLADLTRAQLLNAVEKHNETTPARARPVPPPHDI